MKNGLSTAFLCALGITTFSYANDPSPAFQGFYGGAHLGFAHLETETKETDNNPNWLPSGQSVVTKNNTGAIGLRAGYNWIIRSQILGVLAEASFSKFNSYKGFSWPTPGGNPGAGLMGSRFNMLGSVRAKYGISSHKLAVLATAGAAFAPIKHKMVTVNPSGDFHKNGSHIGTVLGVSAAYALTDISFIELEFCRYKFGSVNHALNGSVYTTRMSETVDVAQISYNMKF